MWLRLNAVGPGGHGSSPSPRSAVLDLIEALERLRQDPFAPRIVPEVGDFFRDLAALHSGAGHLADPERLIEAPERLAALHRTNPTLHALTRNTCAVTRLNASSTINVVAPAAWAELDCRLLPDQAPRAFIHELRKRIAQPSISIEVLLSFTPAVSSTDTDLYRAIESPASPTVASSATAESSPTASRPPSSRAPTRAASMATTSGSRSRTSNAAGARCSTSSRRSPSRPTGAGPGQPPSRRPPAARTEPC